MPHTQSSKSREQLGWDSSEIGALVRAALQEDIGGGDATVNAIVPPTAIVKARIVAKQDLILAGLPLAERVFRALHDNIAFIAAAREGDAVAKGVSLAQIKGNAGAILTGERTVLNFLGRLCGIATLTQRFVGALSVARTRIRDTRKTTPLLRALEKYAVRIGGGTNHRFGLYDAILIKENHIAIAGGVKQALDRAHAYARTRATGVPEMTDYEIVGQSLPLDPGQHALPVQIEVRDEGEMREALAAGASSILLDNVTPDEAARLVKKARGIQSGIVIEISGGITIDNVRAYAEAGADFISTGSLTHSVPAADLSLLVETDSPE